MNMKSLHTQQQIEHALFKLLQKKPYTEISIAEITRKARYLVLPFIAIMTKKMKSLRNFYLINTIILSLILINII